MNSIKKWISIAAVFFLPLCLCAQTADVPAGQEAVLEEETKDANFADPLIPQLFAFDKANQVFAGINTVNNAIDIIVYDGKSMQARSRYQADIVEKRHDVHRIYRPQSVAIYDGHVVFLATQRDSCYLSVLDLHGKELERFYFAGNAFAFSYSPEANELYIAGENDLGYDLAVLDVSNGFDNMELRDGSNFHYTKPKKAEEMSAQDPFGVALTIIALTVVFLGLILLYFSFKYLGKLIMKFNRYRAIKAESISKGIAKDVARNTVPNAEALSGDVYAAIAATIYMYQNELHDEENTTLTIAKVSKTYSPWSSKLYGMNTYFQIKNGK